MPITPLPVAADINFEDLPDLINAAFSEIAADITAAVAAAKTYDQANAKWGKPEAGERLFALNVVRFFTFPLGMAGSRARAIVATTADAVFSLKKSGSEFGTFTFAAGTQVAVFSSVAAVNFSPGDYFEITAPDSQDDTLADIFWNLLAAHS